MEAIMSDSDCENLFNYLIDSPNTIIDYLAPLGWKNSPFVKIFHPDAEEVFEKRLRVHQNIGELFKSLKDESKPTLDEIRKELAENPKEVNQYEKFIEIFGSALWCIFSNNHEVVDEKGRVYDIGSFRGSGGFIADFLNKITQSVTHSTT